MKIKMTNRPLILVTNDDGITAPGIRNLVNFMNEIGDVVVVAPNSPQSGKGHAITINSTLTIEEIQLEGPQKDFSLSGTPVDCVKFALDKVLDRKPDLVVSGINHGANSSINVIYSGTMSAAVEAGVEGLQAIGFSLLDFAWDADFSQSKEFIQNLVKKYLMELQINLFIDLKQDLLLLKFKIFLKLAKLKFIYSFKKQPHF